jgi:dipeptidyl aminopeptidase/acylaminoacyl peptidase
MTLAVSAFYSDRIRCSIDIVGPSNLVTFLEHTEEYRRDLRRVEYGDERDPKMREYLEQIAPMNNIEKIKKPMLVVAGQNDPRVPVSESDQIVAALKKQETPVCT